MGCLLTVETESAIGKFRINKKLVNDMEMTKTIYLRSLILSLLWISVVSTDATVINGINYSLDSDKKEAAVISNSPGYSGDIVIPEEVEYSGTLYSVTSIGW